MEGEPPNHRMKESRGLSIRGPAEATNWTTVNLAQPPALKLQNRRLQTQGPATDWKSPGAPTNPPDYS